MNLQLTDIINRDKGKTGYVLFPGPDLLKNYERINEKERDRAAYKVVCCNNADQIPGIDFDYWLISDPLDKGAGCGVQNYYNRYVSRPKAILLYNDCLDITPRTLVERLLSNINYIGYDDRHFGGNPCTWSMGPGGRHTCCQNLIANRLCIQEVLQKVTNYQSHYGFTERVELDMMATAVISGMSPIYINNIEGFPEKGVVGDENIEGQNKLVNNLVLIRDMAKNIGVDIYCMDPNSGLCDIFPLSKQINGQDVIGSGMSINGSSIKKGKLNKFHYLNKKSPNPSVESAGQMGIKDALKKPGVGLYDFMGQRLISSDIVNIINGYESHITGGEFIFSEYAIEPGKKPGEDIIPEQHPGPADINALSSSSKPNDEYEWENYTQEYSQQLKQIQKEDGMEFFITGFKPPLYSPNNPSPGYPGLTIFKDNLHNNWKAIYDMVLLKTPVSVFEVGFGGGYHLKNIKTISPTSHHIAGCDLLSTQMEYAKQFSDLPKEILNNLEIRDITKPFEVTRQYEFVFTQAVIMHMSTEHAKAALINMGRLSSKYIMLVEGVKNHENWYDMVKECLPEFKFALTDRFINDGVILTREDKYLKSGPELREDLSFKKEGTIITSKPEDKEDVDDLKESVPEGKAVNFPDPILVFTEIVGCAEVGRVALATFYIHHPNHKVVIFATDKDVEELGRIAEHPNNIFYIISQEEKDLFKNGHEGTAHIFAKVFRGEVLPEYNNVVHFDSDVVFKRECLSFIEMYFTEGYDIVGTRRCYLNNPAGMLVKEGTPDTVSTYFYGMKRSVMPKGYNFDDIRKMFLGHSINLEHEAFDFADPITFHALNSGARIHFLDNEYFGGQDENGSKTNSFVANLHLDAGINLIHFGGAGSGCVCFHEPAGKNETYGKWAVVRYALFCKLFYKKDIPVDAGETKFDEKGRWISGNYNEDIKRQIAGAL